MKYLLAILLIVNPLTDVDKIARVNKAKKEAERAYLAGDYAEALAKYQYLIDSLQVKEDRIILNLAHAQYHLQDSINALSNYKQLVESKDKEVSSLAYQQLGEIAFEKQQYEPAMQHFKQALKKNPGNADARYNYELLKKLIQEQQEQQQQQQQQNQENQDQQDQQNEDQQNQDQQNQEQQNQEQQNKDNQEQQDQEQKEGEDQEKEQQEGEEQEQNKPEEGEEEEQNEQEQPAPTPEDKLKEMNISEEKARMILEAMKNNEIQYIQQNKRKAKKRKDPDKPDW
jgi:tetratricopeptide (TPR) repeat protein